MQLVQWWMKQEAPTSIRSKVGVIHAIEKSLRIHAGTVITYNLSVLDYRYSYRADPIVVPVWRLNVKDNVTRQMYSSPSSETAEHSVSESCFQIRSQGLGICYPFNLAASDVIYCTTDLDISHFRMRCELVFDSFYAMKDV